VTADADMLNLAYIFLLSGKNAKKRSQEKCIFAAYFKNQEIKHSYI